MSKRMSFKALTIRSCRIFMSHVISIIVISHTMKVIAVSLALQVNNLSHKNEYALKKTE